MRKAKESSIKRWLRAKKGMTEMRPTIAILMASETKLLSVAAEVF